MQKKTAEPLFHAPTCGCSATISQNHVLLWYPLPIFHFTDVPSVDASAPSCTRAGSIAWQLTGALRFNHFLQNISVCLRAGFCWNWTWRPPMWDTPFVRHSAGRCPTPFGRAVMRTCGRGCGKEENRYLICKVTMLPMNSSQVMGRKTRKNILFSIWIILSSKQSLGRSIWNHCGSKPGSDRTFQLRTEI